MGIKNTNVVGERYKTNLFGWLEIIDYKGTYECTIKFDNTGTILEKIFYTNIKTGSVKDPYAPITFGVGYMGNGEYISRGSDGDKTPAYKSWSKILDRCYRVNRSIRNKSYIGCTIADEWKCFQNFAKWHEDNFKPHMKEWDLDKDLFVKDNRIYSPSTCCFIPQEINKILIRRSDNKNAPMGAIFKNGKFIVRMYKDGKRLPLGSYNNAEQASMVYKTAKEDYIKELAERWKPYLDIRAYNSLISYELTSLCTQH